MSWFRDEQFLLDPYPTYARLRQDSPVLWDPRLGWTLFAFAEVQAALKDPRLSSEVTAGFMAYVPAPLQPSCGAVERLLADFLLYMDPPRHPALKGAVNPYFTPSAVRAYEGEVRRQVRTLLPTQPGPFELMEGLARPLPAQVIGALLEADDPGALGQWSADVANFVGSGSLDTAEILRAAASCQALARTLDELTRQRRTCPGGDLVSALAARDLCDRDVLALTSVLFAAGVDTTASLIGSAVQLLLEHPEQWQRLLEHPDEIEPALEEVLRYDTPSQTVPRVAREPLSLGGHLVAAGQSVLLFVGSAHRDPLRFQEPDRFNIARPDKRHLAFGAGPHFCLGAFLARLQGRVVLEELLERFPRSRLNGPCRRLRRMTLRQLESLPLLLVA